MKFIRSLSLVFVLFLMLGYFNQQPSFSKQDDTFTLWQLPSQRNTISNSYVIRTDIYKISEDL